MSAVTPIDLPVPRRCCSKSTFDSREQADATLEFIERHPTTIKIPTRSYLCPRCFRWHVTSRVDRDAQGWLA